MSRTLIVGADHAGFALKQQLAEAAAELGYVIRDVGTDSEESTDYPDYAHEVANAVVAGEGVGLLVCGTGIGMSMTANRHAGVRAAVCGNVYSSTMARRHNDANVLCLGARVTGDGVAEQVVRVFLDTDFEGGRHQRRIALIEFEQEA